jgi:hypothetical protein
MLQHSRGVAAHAACMLRNVQEKLFVSVALITADGKQHHLNPAVITLNACIVFMVMTTAKSSV